MSMMKRLGALSMAVVMGVSMAACGAASSSQTTGSSNAGQSSSSGTPEVVEQLSQEEILKPYDETVTLTSVRVTNSSATFAPGVSVEDNPVLDKLKEDLNIEVKYDWVVDVTQEDAKMSAMVASGSMPDFFNTTDATLAASLMREGFTMDITDLYTQYASDALVVQDEAFPEGFQSTFIDGRMMGIAELGYGLYNEPILFWVREDWLAQSGKEVPQTMDELVELAKTFMQEHEGTYGIAVDKSLTNIWMYSLIPIMNAYGAYSKIWIEKDGQLEYSSIQPEMKEALAFIQTLYADGVIDKEFAVKDVNKVGEDVAAGKVGIVSGVNWMGWDSLGSTVSLNPEASWIPIAVPSTEQNPEVKLQSNWPVGGYWLINKDCEHPEAVIKMLSWYMENNKDEFQKEEYTTAGNLLYMAPIFQTTPANTVTGMENATAAYEAHDPTELTAGEKSVYDAFVQWYDNKDPNGYGFAMQQGPTGAWPIIREYIESDRVVVTGVRGPDPEEYNLTKPTLEKLEDDTFTKIIMGESIDLFDQFVEDWKALGGDAATAEVNKMYH